MNKKYLKAQSVLEYAVVIGVITAALIAMQVYVKRGIQGGMRSSLDSVGEQYNPTLTTGDSSTRIQMDTRISSAEGLSTFEVVDQHQEKILNEQVGR